MSHDSPLPQDLGPRIDSLFARWARPDSPGAAVSVTRHGREIHRGCYGMADLAHAVPIDERTVIRIGSQTKQFTVLLALMLEAEGKLSMEDDVRRHLPWLPEYPQTVTLRHLAANVGGLRDFLEIMMLGGLDIGAPSTRAGSRGGDDHLVAVLEEGPLLPPDGHGLRPAPRQLDEGPAGLLLRSRDRAGGVEVARAGGGAVDAQVRKHLCR